MGQKLRIIAGHWRGRKISFSNIPHLRPTTDRLRETLFNWLQSSLQDARCLDLFAGSGALIWEALSRGASQATLIETHKVAVKDLKRAASILECHSSVKIHHINAQRWLETYPKHSKGQQYDIVFLDPPFQKNLHCLCLQLLLDHNILDKNGVVYIESSADISAKKDSPLAKLVLNHFQVVKSKTLGSVNAQLLTKL